ncbi:hypothetical protein AMTRI_Chr06g201020 [Amborella trichopoda]|uniref:Calcineurin-like phosphoesterase domain-containing protein n=1 Tax=Amborella trichopoda TaxID=13333 RepID=U5DI46_AMBTC|nr:shewanella-like protein phosphatase 2 [Amborella trichopoda]ERN20248.1 hypothetical protein AMTR_s00066p00158280 [Amborella trichopoda]|eukprot:XP_006858781.1 shewanella-like protein phosphatase 2 [Amborella trichopoda]
MDPICQDVPCSLSNFVDTFVDFTVSGLFLSHQKPQQQQKSTYPSQPRLLAVGDLHGDLQKAKQALKMAQIIDENDRWIAGDSMVVQLGDILDRGGEELKLLYFLEKLKQGAEKSNGKLLILQGNHEIMNIEGDFRYVTKAGLEEFKNWGDWFSIGIQMKSLCKELEKQINIFTGVPKNYPPGIRARIAALRPGGPISTRFLADNPTVLLVGGCVFVHGGILPCHAYLGFDWINEEVKDWINGLKGRFGPDFVRGRDSLVWLRKFSEQSEKNCECSLLEHALSAIPEAKRLIVGHTIQESGINGACNNQVIRVDVGLSKGCINGLPEVLEIRGDSELKVLTSNPLYQKRGAILKQEERVGLGLLLKDNGVKPIEVKA